MGQGRIDQGSEVLAQPQQPLQKQAQGQIAAIRLPVHPADRAVLTPGVVIAPLAAAHLIAHQQHRHPWRQEQGGEQVAQLALAQGVDRGIAAGAFHPMVPTVVVVIAIAVVLAVGEVVLAVEADQVGQGEAVVGGEEVDRAPHRRRLVAKQVGAARQPLGQGPAAALIALPEAAQVIAEAAVPAGHPPGREVIEAVEPAAIPGLTHQLEVAQLGVGLDLLEQGRRIQRLQFLAAAEGDAQIKAEAIHPQFQGPAAHRFED